MAPRRKAKPPKPSNPQGTAGPPYGGAYPPVANPQGTAGPPYRGAYPPRATPTPPRRGRGGGRFPTAPSAPKAPQPGNDRYTPPPKPSGKDGDRPPVRSPDGRWELDVESGEWTPVSGQPIGVPADWTTIQPGPGPSVTNLPPEDVAATLTPRERLPQYFEGDEYTIGYGLSPETIAGIQQSLQDAGIISPTATLPYGVWDNTTANAVKQVLAIANQNGIDWQDALQQTVSTAISATGGGYLNEQGIPYSEIPEPKLPPVLTMPTGYLANPDELRGVVQQVAQRVMGRKADEAFVNQFVHDFQAYQSSLFYSQRWDEQAGQFVGSTVGEMSPETAAEKAVIGDYGDEAGAQELATTFANFEQILAGPFGGSV